MENNEKYYIVKGDVLIDDFVFNIDYSQGTKEFLPDYLTELNGYLEELNGCLEELRTVLRHSKMLADEFLLQQQNFPLLVLRRTKKWLDERAKYEFKLLSREDNKNRERIYAENPDKTAHQLYLLLKKARDTAQIERELNEHMIEWENNQLNIKE